MLRRLLSTAAADATAVIGTEPLNNPHLWVTNIPSTISPSKLSSKFALFGPLSSFTPHPRHSAAQIQYKHHADAAYAYHVSQHAPLLLHGSKLGVRPWVKSLEAEVNPGLDDIGTGEIPSPTIRVIGWTDTEDALREACGQWKKYIVAVRESKPFISKCTILYQSELS